MSDKWKFLIIYLDGKTLKIERETFYKGVNEFIFANITKLPTTISNLYCDEIIIPHSVVRKVEKLT